MTILFDSSFAFIHWVIKQQYDYILDRVCEVINLSHQVFIITHGKLCSVDENNDKQKTIHSIEQINCV